MELAITTETSTTEFTFSVYVIGSKVVFSLPGLLLRDPQVGQVNWFLHHLRTRFQEHSLIPTNSCEWQILKDMEGSCRSLFKTLSKYLSRGTKENHRSKRKSRSVGAVWDNERPKFKSGELQQHFKKRKEGNEDVHILGLHCCVRSVSVQWQHEL
jgi:hypothetical protein